MRDAWKDLLANKASFADLSFALKDLFLQSRSAVGLFARQLAAARSPGDRTGNPVKELLPLPMCVTTEEEAQWQEA